MRNHSIGKSNVILKNEYRRKIMKRDREIRKFRNRLLGTLECMSKYIASKCAKTTDTKCI
jgi:hypothetical protein